MSGLSLAEGRALVARAKVHEREAERACRGRFLRGADHENCVCVPVCSRDYDPNPCSESDPFPPEMYHGTGIAALYGGVMTAAHVLELAGWNITSSEGDHA